MRAERLFVKLAIKAVEQRTIIPIYGVWEDFCNLLKALGSIPSIDMARAKLDVPIVPDSSAPKIETKAPTARIRPPIIERVGEKPSTFEAATVKGAAEEVRVAWSTTPITTKFVMI